MVPAAEPADVYPDLNRCSLAHVRATACRMPTHGLFVRRVDRAARILSSMSLVSPRIRGSGGVTPGPTPQPGCA